MGYVRQISPPASEPVSTAEAKSFCRVTISTDDALIAALITAAREKGERITGRALAQRNFVLVLDSHPYWTDTIQSQLAYPPSYYSLPRYSTTLWNYSQMIKIPYAPLVSVSSMRSVNPDGSIRTWYQDVDFVVDRESEPGRIFPTPGNYWPADLYVANALEIFFTAGYDPDPAKTPDVHTAGSGSPLVPATNQQPDSTIVTAVPQTIRVAIMQTVAHWYNQRESVSEVKLQDVPDTANELFLGSAVIDFSSTRG